MGTPPSQLGGLGERCKLPQRGLGRSPSRQRFFIISCSNHYIKLHAKTEIVHIFHESNNFWAMLDLCTYYNRMLETVFCTGCGRSFHPQVLFLYSACMHGNQSQESNNSAISVEFLGNAGSMYVLQSDA